MLEKISHNRVVLQLQFVTEVHNAAGEIRPGKQAFTFPRGITFLQTELQGITF